MSEKDFNGMITKRIWDFHGVETKWSFLKDLKDLIYLFQVPVAMREPCECMYMDSSD